MQKLEIIDALVHDNMPVFSVSFETHTLMAYQDKDGNLLTAKEYPQVHWAGYKVRQVAGYKTCFRVSKVVLYKVSLFNFYKD